MHVENKTSTVMADTQPIKVSFSDQLTKALNERAPYWETGGEYFQADGAQTEAFRIAACDVDFKNKYLMASFCAGGGPSWEKLLGMTIEELVPLLSRNGIRLTYDEKWNMNSVKDVPVHAIQEISVLVAQRKLDGEV